MSKRKGKNWNYAHNMDIDAWRERQVVSRLKAHLRQREEDFIREHGQDTDEELREYVRSMARHMRRMPHPIEIPGGRYLRQRLGDWQRLAISLGYLPARNLSGQIAYQRMKRQEEEAFVAERRALKAEKKRAKVAKDKLVNQKQAAWKNAQRHHS
ncbi:MAG: hypothetical protein IKO68_02180 [Oscillospiraceae bacterium]|nr:hypothetical protein [Oscillospiraceae bacterium]